MTPPEPTITDVKTCDGSQEPIATDPDISEVATLLGPDAAAVLSAALEPHGADLASARAIEIGWWPGRSITVSYSADVVWSDGSRSTETLVATGGRELPEGALHLAGPGGDIAVWRAPFDPYLPGLAGALDPAVLAALVDHLGVRVDPSSLQVQVRSYRPSRRAVLEVVGPELRFFLKAVRRGKASALHERHRTLAEHVPAPRSLGWSDDHALVAIEALPGRTHREALATGEPLPGPDALIELLDRLPEPPDGAHSWGWRSRELGGVVAATLPDLAGRVGELVDQLERAESALDPAVHPPVPVHGDLHDAQLLVVDGRLSGVLDVDTHAIGRRLDDLAGAIGHLSTLSTAVPHGDRVHAHLERLLAHFDTLVDPVALWRATAAVVLGLATGPLRALEHDWAGATEARVSLVEQWLDSAARLEGQRR